MIRLALHGSVAEMVIDRPAARNAMRLCDWQALRDRVGDARDAGARAILLTGAGGVFSAGSDLSELAALAGDMPAVRAFRMGMRAGIDAMAESAVPVVALVEGDCHGAGVALAAACDVRVAAAGTRFSVPAARHGIGYPQRDVGRLLSLVGRGQAARLLLTAGMIDASEAARIGLVDLIDQTAREVAQALAEAIAGNAAASVALLRRQIGGIAEADADLSFDARFDSPDFAATVARLAAKRAGRRD